MRKLLGFLLCAVCCCSFFGCGDKSGGTKISYCMRGTSSEIALVQQIIDAFEEEYKDDGYEVDLIVADAYYDNLKVYFGGGNEPDVFMMRTGYIESFVREGLLLNLQPYIAKDYGDGADYGEKDLWPINDGYRYDKSTKKWGSGDLYAVIKDWSPDFTMIYNKDFIDQFNNETGAYTAVKKQITENKLHAVKEQEYIDRGYKNLAVTGKTMIDIVGYPSDDGVYPSKSKPMSWAQQELMCFLLNSFDERTQTPQIYGTSFTRDGLKHAVQMVESQGAILYKDDFTRFNATDPKVIAGYQHFNNFQYGSLLSSKRYNTVTEAETDFKNGRAAAIYAGMWAFYAYDLYGLNYGLAPAPTKDGTADGLYENYVACFAHANSISANTKNPDLAWKFLRFYETRGMELSTESLFNISGNKTVASAVRAQMTDPKKQELYDFYVSFANDTHQCTFNPYLDDARVTNYMSKYIPRISLGEYTVPAALLKIAEGVDKDIADAMSIM